MTQQRIHLGHSGEDLAASFLKENGYKILERNVRGPRGEIDIIARDADTVCFIEVKTRSSDRLGLPLEAVSLQKQKKLACLAMSYIKSNRLEDSRMRFDVVSILLANKDTPEIEVIKNAFDVNL